MIECYSDYAIEAVLQGKISFCKFLSSNDTGLTGGHQAGIYIPKSSSGILFSEPGIKGENKDKWVKIKWQENFETDSRFIYYGKGTRNEYRITNFGRNFPFLEAEYTGALFILVKVDKDEYLGYVLNTDKDIEMFLEAFCMSPTETNKLIDTGSIKSEKHEQIIVQKFINDLEVDFPSSEVMSAAAREIYDKVYNHAEYIQSNPDKRIIEWTDMEYYLFRQLEYSRYGKSINAGFTTVDEFIKMANIVLNRRKSRAGKSLENHLAAIFDGNRLEYSAQAVTEGNKKPDFIFPSKEAYHDIKFSADKLVSLAAKTTCKDRWRQILNEADRLKGKPKYLFTLQQGISSAQMDEMHEENVVLVVPQPYIKTYPADRQNRIMTLLQFIQYLKVMEGK